MKRRQRRYGIATLIALAALLAAGAIGLRMWNARHTEFLAVGSDIDAALSTYSKDFKARSMALLGSFYREGARVNFFARPAPPEFFSGVRTVAFLPAGDAPPPLEEQMAAYFGGLDKVENAKFKLNRLYDGGDGRSAHIRVRFQVWGELKGGEGFYDSGLLDVRLGKDEEGFWEITEQEVIEARRIVRPLRTLFTDVTEASGLAFSYGSTASLNEEVADYKFSIITKLPRGSGVADVDGDGDSDLLITGVERSGLFLNDGAGRFTEAAAQWGLRPEATANGVFPLFADLDNDGDADLLLLRLFGDSRLFRNEGGRFADVTGESGIGFSPQAMTACAGDYDGDGFLDLFIGSYGDTRAEVPETVVRSRNGRPSHLYRNRGDWTFEDVTARAGIEARGWALACTFFDLNEDGRQDLYVANDFGYNELYTNDGDGTFTNATWESGTHDIGSSMSVSLVDYDGDGRLDLYTSNIASNTIWFQGPGMKYILGRFLTNSSTFRQTFDTFVDLGTNVDYAELEEIGYKVNNGNSLMRNLGGGRYGHVENPTRTAWAEWAWGATAGDFDNDGDADIYVANGFITAPDTRDF